MKVFFEEKEGEEFYSKEVYTDEDLPGLAKVMRRLAAEQKEEFKIPDLTGKFFRG